LDGLYPRGHADLHPADIHVVVDGVYLCRDHVRRHIFHGPHASGVLCGERRDHAGSKYAERGEGLEVCLNAGTPAAVRAGYGERDLCHWQLSLRTASTAARIARVAVAISAARKILEIMATPDAPARTTSPARIRSIPAIAPTGMSGRADRMRARSRAKPSKPTGGSGLFLESVSNTPPMQA